MLSQLKAKYSQLWQSCTTHLLTTELSKGELHLDKLYVYLDQDFKFFHHFVKLLAKAISIGNELSDNVVLGKQMGFICSDENTYFVDSIKTLSDKISAPIKASFANSEKALTLASVSAYNDYMLSLIESDTTTFEQVVTVLFVMEQVYLEWANEGLKMRPEGLSRLYNDWIILHTGEDFERWCWFLNDLVNKYYTCPRDETTRLKMEECFEKTLNFELDFFQDCYGYGE